MMHSLARALVIRDSNTCKRTGVCRRGYVVEEAAHLPSQIVPLSSTSFVFLPLAKPIFLPSDLSDVHFTRWVTVTPVHEREMRHDIVKVDDVLLSGSKNSVNSIRPIWVAYSWCGEELCVNGDL